MGYIVASNVLPKGSLVLAAKGRDLNHLIDLLEHKYEEVEFLSVGDVSMWPEYWPHYITESIEAYMDTIEVNLID